MARRVGSVALVIARGRVVRMVLAGLTLLAAGWLVFSNVWQPLQQSVGLPVGVTPRNPELDSSALNAINAQRAERASHQAPTFIEAERLFVPARPSPVP